MEACVYSYFCGKWKTTFQKVGEGGVVSNLQKLGCENNTGGVNFSLSCLSISSRSIHDVKLVGISDIPRNDSAWGVYTIGEIIPTLSESRYILHKTNSF